MFTVITDIDIIFLQTWNQESLQVSHANSWLKSVHINI